MNILIVAATEKEIEPLLEKKEIELLYRESKIKSFSFNNHRIDVLVTGVGMVQTAYSMGKWLSQKNRYDLAINMGIAGGFNATHKIGDVVNVKTDCFAELGAENGNKFLTIKDIGLNTDHEIINNSKVKNKIIKLLAEVNGITVNTVHGNEASIKKIKQRLDPDVESMEGAAFMLACKNEKLNYIQIRSISNYVERRNKKNWNIPLAVKNLNKKIVEIISSM